MVLQTRYRDIPFEEAAECQRLSNLEGARKAWESRMRGGPVVIQTPPVEISNARLICKGPFYAIDRAPGPGVENIVCPHIAEIGD